MTPRRSGPGSAAARAHAALLRQEARAWRRMARDGAPFGHLFLERYGFPSCEAQSRVSAHYAASGIALQFESVAEADQWRILAALFLALECEDEARAIAKEGGL